MSTNGKSFRLPSLESYPAWYGGYAKLVQETSIPDALRKSRKLRKELMNNWPESKATYRYAEGKWSVQELLLHMVDSERVFVYRAMSFARGEQTSLPGYDHEAYVETGLADGRSLKSVLKEVRNTRKATLAFFEGLTTEQIERGGTANGVPMTVGQLGVVIAGHERHHLNVLQEKYRG